MNLMVQLSIYDPVSIAVLLKRLKPTLICEQLKKTPLQKKENETCLRFK
jgi:hypothetical protein